MQPRTTALIVAAGSGTRAGGDIPKQYAPIAGKAVLAHAIDALAAHPRVDEIRVVIGAGQEQLYADAIGARMIAVPVIGGVTRRESVANGLAATRSDQILIHDAARPFLPGDVVDRLLAALEQAPGAVPVLPVADTLAEVGDDLGPNVPRERLARVQTPQAFRTDAIRAAHAAWDAGKEATDDAQIARAAGLTVKTVEGSPALDKLTFPADFAAAEQRLAAAMVSRTALGFDVHGFTEGDGLWIGGIRIPHSRALAGHSDADVGLHALTDALLGTIGDGDIGTHFPPSDPRWRGAASHLFLAHARGLIAARGGRIDHVDLTIICEEPKVGPHRAAIRARIAELLGLTETKISIKATTTERLGFTGRREGVAAQAAATVRLPETE
ncbi:MAG TPA: bifunctional 2-C-methyl-D-erythritol 4-phosphate cytidylyltransferase/2-C-methyl-D-erythritol 2,4-cyclodiphosphate synthase [Sphingomonas sp.]|uniref:bifunctional 2-C-methyl-D-erythritol 4-phosphate cytidylyltransferase/2-C-methyl-D-erythritol 2,4-cyclodiphosphate synthase n=1 Tax=Sphingomonas sp. TaxID=28214 RepID=UPI002B8F6D4F|nr:bifunctional 2-C-methyl-D-erythritol 4-phosphate cytidylyltransferase/2-C-methyl-D-erythritol 2,4-cyclodiphosphate synthase [Sphingomonas sp.]HMI18253.1 bifunctional 2-C-methyl-D-erythritol 4-phosphate cytidylyltransferase/2-C-methyl-D-erythritol 2,4-cyclodiphosphate synthase [Sphingomonas sp.]